MDSRWIRFANECQVGRCLVKRLEVIAALWPILSQETVSLGDAMFHQLRLRLEGWPFRDCTDINCRLFLIFWRIQVVPSRASLSVHTFMNGLEHPIQGWLSAPLHSVWISVQGIGLGKMC